MWQDQQLMTHLTAQTIRPRGRDKLKKLFLADKGHIILNSLSTQAQAL